MRTTIERGWPGHYICANRCLFRRNTLIGDLADESKLLVVSSVGCQIPTDEDVTLPDAIGYDRYYETLAFIATRRDYKGHTGSYIDADCTQQVRTPAFLRWCISYEDMQNVLKDNLGIDNVANDMHDHIVVYFSTLIPELWDEIFESAKRAREADEEAMQEFYKE